MQRSKIAVALLLTAIAFSGCERSSRLAVESRDLGQFAAIDFNGAAEIKITVGVPATFSVEGSQRALKSLETNVHDNVLKLRAERSSWGFFLGDQSGLKLSIGVPALASFESNGAGNIRIEGLAGGDHRVRIVGAHNVEATGTLESLSIQLDGAGNVDYSDVVVKEAKVRLNGTGNIVVQPVEGLDAEVNGVGAVHYIGEPKRVQSSIHGLGTIKRK